MKWNQVIGGGVDKKTARKRGKDLSLICSISREQKVEQSLRLWQSKTKKRGLTLLSTSSLLDRKQFNWLHLDKDPLSRQKHLLTKTIQRTTSMRVQTVWNLKHIQVILSSLQKLSATKNLFCKIRPLTLLLVSFKVSFPFFFKKSGFNN